MLFISQQSPSIRHPDEAFCDSSLSLRVVLTQAASIPSARSAGLQTSGDTANNNSDKSIRAREGKTVKNRGLTYQNPYIREAKPMDRPEQCFHCRDLHAEFEEVRAQQRALEDQVRSMEARQADQIRNLEAKLDEQCRILHDKYRAEMNLFLHRVHSLHEQFNNLSNRGAHAEESITEMNLFLHRVHSSHEQFNNLSNRCAHAEESITVLRYMMEKKYKEASSSCSAKNEADQNPEDSTARQISHIEID